MATTDASRSLINAPVGKTLWEMTWPVIFGVATLISFNVVDTFFISLLGTDPLAAVSFTFPITFTVVSLTIGLGIGTSAVIARKYGRDKPEEAQFDGFAALSVSALLVLMLSAIGYIFMDSIFTLLQAQQRLLPLIREYMTLWFAGSVMLVTPMVGNAVLRASGDTRTPSLIMASGGLANAIFDPILIFGWGPIPAMGIEGAALASVISWFSGVILVFWLLSRKQLIRVRIETTRGLFREWLDAARAILKIGLPAAGANILTPLAMSVMTAIIASYGAAAVAAFGVGTRLESLASIIILALSMSLPPLISQNFGANRVDRVREAYGKALKAVFAIQLVIYAAMAITAPWIAMAFAKEQEVARIVELFIYIMPIGYGFQGWIILSNSSFNAIHKPMRALGLSVIRLFVFFVPLSYLGSLLADLHGLFIGGVVANIITAAIAYLWFTRELRRVGE
ncbi:putative MATE family efflux protein [Idiomarina fontislapidosi]|mgnify:FL=1|uniref:MATE family efflux transporter n=1 Tax=Idiomarina fontislapidosi TaxID=263723 RepID=A0A432XXC9_9GAMM|nr:MATE family efflux transporter [Idiomarina fontislapidosi]PYE32079.1 putative MATE family efflux protein [Idiomarina fontislapidosi]RUO53284.1 MATE family efflux transporter [Idiomarina fontislapidosi]|tara:strand:- start:5055 stop:6413 length:1359 start_codon:yes stop_codon:yes gene_type:complete